MSYATAAMSREQQAAIVWGAGVAVMIAFLSSGAPWWDMFALWAFIAVATFCIALGC